MAFIACWAFCFQIEIEANECAWRMWVSEWAKKPSSVWNRHELQTFFCVCVCVCVCAITTHSSQFKVSVSKMLFPCNTKWNFYILRWRWRWRKMKWNETKRSAYVKYNIFSLFIETKWVLCYAVCVHGVWAPFVQSLHRFPLHLHYIRFYLWVRARCLFWIPFRTFAVHINVVFVVSFSFLTLIFSHSLFFFLFRWLFFFHHHPRSHRIDWIYRSETCCKISSRSNTNTNNDDDDEKKETKYSKNVTAKRRSNCIQFYTHTCTHSQICLITFGLVLCMRGCLYIHIFIYFYRTCRFSQLFDLLMSLRQIFCKISLAKFSDMCVRELRIFMALWAAAFLSRVSFRRIYVCVLFKFERDVDDGDDSNSSISTNTRSNTSRSDGSSGDMKAWEKKRKKRENKWWIFMEHLSMMCDCYWSYVSFFHSTHFSRFLYVLLITKMKRCVCTCVSVYVVKVVGFFTIIEIEIYTQHFHMIWNGKKDNMQFFVVIRVLSLLFIVNVCVCVCFCFLFFFIFLSYNPSIILSNLSGEDW